MNIEELNQIEELIIKLTNYIDNLTNNNKKYQLDNIDSIKEYNEYIKTIPEEKLEAIDNKINIYFESYTKFLESKQII